MSIFTEYYNSEIKPVSEGSVVANIAAAALGALTGKLIAKAIRKHQEKSGNMTLFQWLAGTQTPTPETPEITSARGDKKSVKLFLQWSRDFKPLYKQIADCYSDLASDRDISNKLNSIEKKSQYSSITKAWNSNKNNIEISDDNLAKDVEQALENYLSTRKVQLPAITRSADTARRNNYDQWQALLKIENNSIGGPNGEIFEIMKSIKVTID